jgi:hypothetical protein
VPGKLDNIGGETLLTTISSGLYGFLAITVLLGLNA